MWFGCRPEMSSCLSSALGAFLVLQMAGSVFWQRAVSAECCQNELQRLTPFCQAYEKKSVEDKARVRGLFGENCQELGLGTYLFQ